MTTDVTAVSLFAGVEGIGLALERAGVKVVAAVEIDDAARGVIADQFPNIHLFRDVTEVTGDQLRRAGFVPERGITAAGWPCQGNSVAGRREGMADPRSGLWRHVVRLLAETRSRWFLGENVPGLLSVNDGDDIAIVRKDLAQLGYWWAERVLDAQHFGVPQRRRRVFFVGCLGDARRPVQVLLEPEGSGRDSTAGVAQGERVAATLTAGVARPGVSAPGRRQEDDVNIVIAPTITARYGKGTDSDATDAIIVSTLQGGGKRGHRIDAEAAGGGTSSSCHRRVVAALTSSGVGTCGPDDNQAQAGHLVVTPEIAPTHPRPGSNSDGAVIATHTHTFQKIIRSGARDVNGDLPPEVWAEREVAATLNLNDLGSESRAVELVVQPLAILGRDDGANLEIGPEGGPYNALRAGDGGSSRQSLVWIHATGRASCRACGHDVDDHSDRDGLLCLHPTCLRFQRGERCFTDDGQPTCITGDTTHALTSEGADASEDGTGRGTPIVFAHANGIDAQPSSSSSTLRAGHDTMPSVQHGTTVRRLTPRECERLQGFPDDWTLTSNGKPQADSARYRQMGNSVAVPVVEWIARRIVEVDG